MPFSFLSRFSKRPQERDFLSLVLTDGVVAASLWTVKGSAVSLSAYSAAITWDPQAEASAVEACDVALESLGTRAIKVREVLFGLPDDWVKGVTITPEKKNILRSITTQLNLQSVGFVVTTEALLVRLREQNLGSLNAVVVFLENKHTTVVVAHQGEVFTPVHVGRSTDVVSDVMEALTRSQHGPLPHKIVLASLDVEEEKLQTARESLLQQSWDPSLFSQVPTITILKGEETLDAVSYQGGKEVAKALGLPVNETQEPTPIPVNEDFGFSPLAVDEPHEAASEASNIPGVTGDSDETLSNKISLSNPVPFIRRKVFMFAGGGILLLILLISGFILLLRSQAYATVSLTLKPTAIERQETIVLDTTAQVSDPIAGVLKADIKTTQTQASEEIPTTGKKIIGDKASGTVTISNGTSQERTLKAGTELSKGNLKFSLTEDITIASASSNFDGTVNGKASAKVQAVAIGVESNIEKDSELQVDTFDKSAFVAKSESPFTGGNSRTIQAVADGDIVTLEKTVVQKLKDEGKTALSSQISEGEYVIITNDMDVDEKQYSSKVGDEAKTLSLTMKATVTGIVFTKSDVANFLKDKLTTEITAGSVLKDEKTGIDIIKQDSIDDHRAQVQARLYSEIVPTLDVAQLAKVLSGKPLGEARLLLGSMDSISTSSLSIKPALAGIVQSTMPDARKITITITQ